MFGDRKRVDTSRFIGKYFPGYRNVSKRWKRFYPSSYNGYDYCGLKFYCKYFTDIKVPMHPLAILGIRCHDMKHLYFVKVNIQKLIDLYRRTGDRDVLVDYIFRHFSKVILNESETAVMRGFSNIEADRLISIMENHNSDEKIKRLYLPLMTEKTIKTENFGGKLDVLFRDLDHSHIPCDWKDGLSRPYKPLKEHYSREDLKKGVSNQIHIYGILLDDKPIYDTYMGEKIRVVAENFLVIYPRYEIIVFDRLSDTIKMNIRQRADYYLELVNDHIFYMRCEERFCHWNNKNYPCEYFKPVCQKIMENELGMYFEPKIDDEFPEDEINI